jgi:hypothetical protein
MKRTSLAQARLGYDDQFESDLADEIVSTIASASLLSDRRAIAIRTAETINALLTALETMSAVTPTMADAAELHKFTEYMARRVRKNVEQFCRDPQFNQHVLGKPHSGEA